MAAKSGIQPSECLELAKHVKIECPNLRFSGLMTIGMLDYTSTPENFKVLDCVYIRTFDDCVGLGLKKKNCARPSTHMILRLVVFKCLACFLQTLASCREVVCKELDIPVEECELSMGMSGDFELAVSVT